MLISRYRTKLIVLLISLIVFGLAYQVLAKLIITEILYDVSSSDNGYEWVELYNFSHSPIDLANYSLGYGGKDYTYGKFQLSGGIQAFSCFVVGGPKVEEKNANPEYDQIEDFNPDIQNVTDTAADGVALFDVPVDLITSEMIPIDAIIYGRSNEKNLIDETGKPGDVDVEDAPAGSSIERTIRGWHVQSNPNPGELSSSPLVNRIPWIQGDGDVSPYVDEIVNEVRGIVTAYIAYKKGFFMQEPLGDLNPTTSDGIFVYKGNNSSIPYINLGDEVSVTGEVEEHNGLTQIDVSGASGEVKIISSGNDLPESVELDPPALLEDALSYFESVEGMLVSASDGVVVGPTDRYGQFVIVRQHVFDGRYFYNPYNQNGERIMVDDVAGIRADVKLDDTIVGIVGVLDYNYGDYKIDATEQFQVTSGDLPEPIPPVDRANEFTIATFNLENFFDTIDDPDKEDPVLTEAEYSRKKQSLALAIKYGLHAPDIIAVQEAEKIEVLEDLTNIYELSDSNYVANLIEGPDPRGIDVGLLTRSDRVKVIDLRQEQAPLVERAAGSLPLVERAAGSLLDDSRVNLFSRPPLVAALDVYRQEIDVGDAYRLYLIVCHFKSMLGGEAETEPRRVEQARFVTSLVDEIFEDEPDAKVVVLGDLNATRTTAPIVTLTNGTTPGSQLKMLNSEVKITDQYSYIYEGKAQYLDYIFVTDNAFNLVQKVDVAHINAGLPYSHSLDNRSSDHDPILARFFFESNHKDCSLLGDLSGDGKVTAYDASLILQFVVGLIDKFPVETMAIPKTIIPQNRTISIPDLSVKAGDQFCVPIFVDNTDDMLAGAIVIRFDPTVLKPINVMSNLKGVYFQSKIDGNQIRFAFVKSIVNLPIHDEQDNVLRGIYQIPGTLAIIEFKSIGKIDDMTTNLSFDHVQLVESGSIKTIDGSITFLPKQTALLQNYPNPFNPETWIPFQLSESVNALVISIYDIEGQIVREIKLGNLSAGMYVSKKRSAYWDGRNKFGERVGSGIYFYHLRTDNFKATRKMVIWE